MQKSVEFENGFSEKWDCHFVCKSGNLDG